MEEARSERRVNVPFKDNIALSKHGFLSVPRRCVCALDLKCHEDR